MIFNLTVLGSGAAIPTSKRHPSSQYINCNERHILIDCAEGTQLQMRRFGVKFQKLNIILISHLHGDHYFGLVGLISTMHLLGRNKNLTIVGPTELKEIVTRQLTLGSTKLDFEINFVPLTGSEAQQVYEDRIIEIHTFPLKHRIPCNGYIIKEKQRERNLHHAAMELPGMKLEYIPILKNGEDVLTPDGNVFLSSELTHSPLPSRSYAYCSDTKYDEKIIPFIQNATCLYHEATFLEKDKERAHATFHSTAKEAAMIAQKSKVRNLVLGHLSARYENGDLHVDEAKSIFENVIYAEDGMNLSIDI